MASDERIMLCRVALRRIGVKAEQRRNGSMIAMDGCILMILPTVKLTCIRLLQLTLYCSFNEIVPI